MEDRGDIIRRVVRRPSSVVSASETATASMACGVSASTSSVSEASPQAQLIFDRFHVLQKNPWNLHDFERDKVAMVQRVNKRLYRAYLLEETLLAVLDRRQVNVASAKLDEWLAWACRSKLAPFVKLARTIRKHRDGILAYVQTGLNNGRIEGLNGKARTITRRAYGFHSALSLNRDALPVLRRDPSTSGPHLPIQGPPKRQESRISPAYSGGPGCRMPQWRCMLVRRPFAR